MNIFSRFANQFRGATKKSFSDQSFSNLFNQSGVNISGSADSVRIRLRPRGAINFYRNVQPVATSVDLISDGISEIPVKVIDRTTDEFVNHDVLDLLRAPSDLKTSNQFFEELAAFYCITGNVFIIATGRLDAPPIELRVISPENVTIDNGENCAINRITVNVGGCDSVSFERDETPAGVRFIETNTPVPLREIWVIRDFNPIQNENELLGMSRLTPIYLMIAQNFSSNKYNLNLLKNGAQISGIVSFLEDIDIEGRRIVENQFNQTFSGEDNANKTIFTNAGELKYEPTGQTNNDMQFSDLVSRSERAIYNQLKIPLALVTGESMTFSNLETAKLSLFDNAIKPTLDQLLASLSLFLFPRYPDSENLELTYSEIDIPALELRRSESLRNKKELGVFSQNELRAESGVGSFEGGDTIYTPSNSFPAGEFVKEIDTENA